MSILHECTEGEDICSLLARISNNGKNKWAWENARIYNMAQFRLRGWIPREEIRSNYREELYHSPFSMKAIHRLFYQADKQWFYAFGIAINSNQMTTIVIRPPPNGQPNENLSECLTELLNRLGPVIFERPVNFFSEKRIHSQILQIISNLNFYRIEVVYELFPMIYYMAEEQRRNVLMMTLPTLPSNILLTTVDPSRDAQLVHKTVYNKFAENETVEGMELRLTRLPNRAVREESSGDVIGWMTAHESGQMFHSFTMPEYRKLRLNESYCNALAQDFVREDLAILSGALAPKLIAKFNKHYVQSGLLSLALDSEGRPIQQSYFIVKIEAKNNSHI